MIRTLITALTLLHVAGTPNQATAQSVATRTPNIAGGWTAPIGVIQLNFLHRFSLSEAPLRKLTNTPTFHVATGISQRLMAGFTYGSNSALVPSYPNEWEFHARALPLSESTGAPLDVSVQAGYNVASESVDGELLLSRTMGPLRALVAGRAFSDGYDGDRARYAVGAGGVLRLTRSISVAGDYSVLLDREQNERAAWGGGLQLGVPYTPHSFSVHATNVGTASLEGVSRGSRTRWGFEYTVPITIARYTPQPAPETGGAMPDRGEMEAMTPVDEMHDMDEMAEPMDDLDDLDEPMDEMNAMDEMDDLMLSTDTVVVEIRAIKFQMPDLEVAAGTTVVWVNLDPIQHSVTATEAMLDSGLVDPQMRFSMRFTETGDYEYHCTPHPFMKGRVSVTAATGGGS